MKSTPLLCALWLLALWLVACGANAPSPPVAATAAAQISRPTLLVSAPADGAQIGVGTTVQVQSTSHDTRGVLRVELWVDGALYRADVAKETDAPRDATISQSWLAKDAGAHRRQLCLGRGLPVSLHRGRATRGLGGRQCTGDRARRERRDQRAAARAAQRRNVHGQVAHARPQRHALRPATDRRD